VLEGNRLGDPREPQCQEEGGGHARQHVQGGIPEADGDVAHADDQRAGDDDQRKLSVVVAALPRPDGEMRAKTEVCSNTRRMGLRGVYSRVTTWYAWRMGLWAVTKSRTFSRERIW
jgi:hypothetical protein